MAGWTLSKPVNPIPTDEDLHRRLDAIEDIIYQIRLKRHTLEYPPGHAEHHLRAPKPPGRRIPGGDTPTATATPSPPQAG